MLAVRRAVPLLGPLVIIGVDIVRQRQWPLITAGLLDEAAHIVTGVLLHDAVGLPQSAAALAGTLAGATLLDADHVPHHLGWRVLTRHTDRPLTHSIVSVLIVAVLSRFVPSAWRLPMTCTAFGAATQLIRDLGTGFVPLWWPFSRREVRMPYLVYLAVVVLSTAVTITRRTAGKQPRGCV